MALNQIDAVTGFANVIENVPKWSEQIAQLAAYTARKHEEFRAEYLKLVQPPQPRRTRSRSICSLHSNDDKDVPMTSPKPSSSAQTPTVDHAQFSPLDASNRYIYAQANKKRRAGTSFRSGASGPMKFRSRQKVVIYYDSYVQDQFEGLVKDLSSCRNTLRKAKMTYTVSKGFQLPTLRRPLDHLISSDPASLKTSPLSQSSPRLPLPKVASTTTDVVPVGEAAFVQADKKLEMCQNVCETAAHQFLRDGDCKTELDTVLSTLTSVLEEARVAHDIFKSEDEVDGTKRSNSMSDSVHTTSGSTLVEKMSREQLNLKRKSALLGDNEMPLLKERPILSTAASAPPLMTEIEVDDDSDADSIEIDITQFRSNRAAYVRV